MLTVYDDTSRILSDLWVVEKEDVINDEIIIECVFVWMGLSAEMERLLRKLRKVSF